MTTQIHHLVLVFLISLVVALLLVPVARTLLTRLGLVDQPSARRINKKPIPRGGGVAVFLAYHAAFLSWCFLMGGKDLAGFDFPLMSIFGIATAFLLLVGFLDDAFDLKPLVKLAGQIVVFTLIFKSGVSLGGVLWFDVPDLVDYVITLGWYIIIVNAFNLVDGLDGLAAGLALIGSLGLSICLASRGRLIDVVPIVALAGACLGFLRYNFSPASIFLGDSGSMFIGFVLATIPLISGGKSAFLASVGAPLLVMGVPIFDTTLAIWRRSMRALLPQAPGVADKHHGLGKIMQPDMNHLHHRFLATGLSQRQVAWVLYFLSTVMVLVAVGATFFTNRSSGIILLGLLVVFVIMARHLSNVELWDTGRALLVASHGSKFSRISQALYLAADIIVLLLAWMLSFHLALLFAQGFHLVSVFPIFFCSIASALMCGGAYRRLWGAASVRDHAILVILVFVGSGVGYALTVLFGLRYYGFYRQIVIFTFLSAISMLLIRMGRILLKAVMAAVESSRLRQDPHSVRSLAYGAGEHLMLLDDITAGSELGRRDRVIVGVIDDNPLLRGRFLRGYRILGGIDCIEDNIGKSHIDEILILTDNLTDEHFERVMEIARRHKLAVMRLRCLEEPVPVSSPADAPSSQSDTATSPGDGETREKR